MDKKHFLNQHGFILLIIVIGILFRFIPLFQYQFSHDELSAISRTIFPTLQQTINYGVTYTDTHPLLIQLFLWFWVKCVGYNEVGIKLPFLISGVLVIWFMYKFCIEFFSKQTALLAASFVSCSFIFLVYSSYARMYAPGILFSMLLLIFSFKIIFYTNPSGKNYILFAITALLCAYNNHLNCFFAFTVALLTLLYIPKQNLKLFLITCACIIAAYLPHLSITLHQLSIGGIGASAGGWLLEPRSNEYVYFIKTLFGSGKIGLAILCAMIALMLTSIFKLIPFTKKQGFLLLLFIVNYAVIYLYSIFRNPILQNSVLLFSGIAFIVFMCSFATLLSVKKTMLLSSFFILLMSFQTIKLKNYFSKVHVQSFESQVKTAINMQHTYGKQQVYSLYKCEPFFVYLYEKKYQTIIPHKNIFDSVFISLPKLNQFASQLNQSIVVLGGLSAGEVQVVKQYFPYLVSHNEDYFRDVTVLSKNKLTTYDDVSVLEELKPLNNDLSIYLKNKKSMCFINDSLVIDFNQYDDAFPVSFSVNLNQQKFKSGQYLVAELTIQCDSTTQLLDDKLAANIGADYKSSVFYAEVKIIDFVKRGDSKTTVFVEVFLNDYLQQWKDENMKLTFFIWKSKQSNFKVLNLKVKQLDYNPTKWKLWN